MNSNKQFDSVALRRAMPTLHPSPMLFFLRRTRNTHQFTFSLIALACMPVLNVNAQQNEEGSSSRRFKITPTVAVSETYSDNINLSSTNRQSEFTTQLSPGVSVASNAGRLKGNFDYSLTQVLYARNSNKNELQNSLNASGAYEAIENWAFLDFGSTISQQSISAFGAQSLGNATLNSNRTEVATYRLSPYIRGNLSAFADYEVRYRYETSKSKSSARSDVETREGSIRLNGDSSFRSLQWSSDLISQDFEYSVGRKTSSDRLNLNLTYAVYPQLNLIVLAGVESSNYTSFDKESHGSKGLGINWRVSDMTRLSGQAERRYFGNTHILNLEHRTPRTAWAYTDNKSVTTSNDPNNLTGLGGLYDLLYSQFSTIEPDPIKRAQLVRSFLQVNGQDPSADVVGSYATSNLSLQRSQALSFALIGVRDAITLTASRSTGQLIGTVFRATDDFANTNVIRQNGLTVSYSHRLTPDASLNVLLSQQESAGDSSALQTRLRTFNVNLSTRFAEKVYGNLGARHTISDGSSSPYKENSLTGSVNIQF